jgi:hypothetical protein
VHATGRPTIGVTREWCNQVATPDLGSGALGRGGSNPPSRTHLASATPGADPSGPGTLKSRNLAANPAGSVSVRLCGIDLVLEGEAHRVTDSSTLERMAAVYRMGGWPASVEGDALTAPYSAPSAGPAPWHLYRLMLHTAVGVATAEPHGATRWDFAPDYP